ncbi:SUN domain-containing protein 5 isoform X2 [Zalophus californianus]|uniref:SUN domain-containing protein 5 isoform X2 n=1 Tax=Zalophus californianus TaxID=9704 RepID=A0A6J2FCW2_ZALCA|nr:SUN domain-containing protein 5 isoform X2 [Zalophus californianus]
MPRSSRSPGDLCDPPEDVRPRRGPKRWMAPEHVNAACLQCPLRPRLASRSRNACRITEDTLSNTTWITSLACFLRTQVRQILFSTCRCKQFFQKLVEKTGVLVLCAFGFWMFSMHLPSKMEVWQDDSINSPLQSLRMYQEKVRHHTGEIQDLRGNMTQLIAKLQLMEAMSDEEKLAQKIMKMIQGDFIEKPDFALKSIGASIDFEQTSATYNHDKARSYWNWIRLWNYAQPPDVILEPNMTPGNCWAFSGDRGQVTIRLAQKVYLSNLTLQHIPKTISLSGSLDTAPKDFVIYGMEGSPREEVFLGAFQFQPENIIQMFQLQNQLARAFGAVKVKISSNWGNPRFTCLYRVRVHGSVTPPRMP